jgi:hypothetical protein
MHVGSYPSIFNVGHKAIADLFTVPVIVEEKVDGSQFSFREEEDGTLSCRSKGADLIMDAPEKMFVAAVATVKHLAELNVLHRTWTYRAEYLAKPHHNTLVYDRTPRDCLIVFDVNYAPEAYLSPEAKAAEAERIGLECVPVLYRGMITTAEQFRALMDTDSVLGGTKIEGVVIKPESYNLYGQDKKCLMGKFVSEAFKEVHGHEWRDKNPTSGDIIQRLISKYGTEARWQKAVQHLREAGQLEQSPRDIGALLKEVVADVAKECTDAIKDDLYKWAWDHIRRGLTAGMPEWYKEQLVKLQFEGKP